MSHFRRFRSQIAHKWSLLMLRLGYVRVVSESPDGVVRVAIPLTEGEANIVTQFQAFQAQQAAVYAAHAQKEAGGGCGGCPSRGGCSEAEPDVGDTGL